MTEPTKEQVDEWKNEYQEWSEDESNPNPFQSDMDYDEYGEACYLAAKKSDLEKIAELEKLSEMQARDAFSRYKEIQTLKEQLTEAVELLRYVQHPKNTDEWVDCGKEVDRFLEKQNKENKDEK